MSFAGAVDVLGTEYTIEVHKYSEDSCLDGADGYCDKTSKKIVVADISKKNSNLDKPEVYQKKVLRHEIVHAFLFESGLAECASWKYPDGQEQLVDWLAYQGPKIIQAWRFARAL